MSDKIIPYDEVQRLVDEWNEKCSWDGSVLMAWDRWRKGISEGCKGSGPRDEFENILGAMIEDMETIAASHQALHDENERLRQDRYEALSVTSRDGLLSSEWVARTGKAERRADKLHAQVKGLEAREAELEEVLEELTYLKRHKDKEGKTIHYQERQPKAWDAANALLKEKRGF